jgi:hypothetical protein
VPAGLESELPIPSQEVHQEVIQFSALLLPRVVAVDLLMKLKGHRQEVPVAVAALLLEQRLRELQVKALVEAMAGKTFPPTTKVAAAAVLGK